MGYEQIKSLLREADRLARDGDCERADKLVRRAVTEHRATGHDIDSNMSFEARRALRTWNS